MRAELEHLIYGDPPVTKVRRKQLSCGHWRGRAIIGKDLKTAWCWECQGRVRTVRVKRIWRRLTKRP